MTDGTFAMNPQRKIVPEKKFFLCYECGETFHVKAKYEEHILLHQAILFCYQIFEYETAKVTSQLDVENEKTHKKSGISRRNTFTDLPRKCSSQFVEVNSARRKTTYPMLKSEKSVGNRNSAPSRSREFRRKSSLSNSLSPHSLERSMKRKLCSPNTTLLDSLPEKKVSIGRPCKRKRGGTIEGSEVPKKISRIDESRPHSAGVIIDAVMSSSNRNIVFSSLDMTAEKSDCGSSKTTIGTASQKSEECIKDLMNEYRSGDASSSVVSTTSSSVASSTSSSLFSSPSSSDSSSFSSPSSDSLNYKKRVSSKSRRVNRESEKDYVKVKTIRNIKSEVRDCNEEEMADLNEAKECVPQIHQDEKASSGLEKIEGEDKICLDDVNEEEFFSGVEQQNRMKSKEKKLSGASPSHSRFGKIEKKIEKKATSGIKSVEKYACKIKVPNIRVASRETCLKEGSPKIPNPTGTVQNKGESSKLVFRSSVSTLIPGQKCVACDFISSQGSEMIEHVTQKHSASVVKLEKKDCVDGMWSGSNEIEPDEKCVLCDRYFEKSSDYFIHVIICHKASLFAPKADRFTCTAHLAHPHLPTHKINITLKRPQIS